MEQQSLWQAFEKSGTVEDYLRYRQAVNAVLTERAKDGDSRDPQNRRPHREGK